MKTLVAILAAALLLTACNPDSQVKCKPAAQAGTGTVRYRWLRNCSEHYSSDPYVLPGKYFCEMEEALIGDKLDAAIDEAIKIHGYDEKP